MLQPLDLDSQALARQFDRRAADFERNDYLLREVERRMFSRLEVVRIQPARILDLGCGLGGGVAGLSKRFPEAQVDGIDLSARMIGRARQAHAAPPGGVFTRFLSSLGARQAPVSTFHVGDLARLPAGRDSVGLLWSNLVLHWLGSPEAALAEMMRVSKPGGLLMFSALGVDTLQELRPARQAGAGAVDFMSFRDMHDWGDALVEAGFAEPVMDMERIQLSYDSPTRMLEDVHALGGNALHGRRKGLCTATLRGDLTRAIERLPRIDGKLILTFEVVYGHAWVPARKKREDGLATVEFLPRPPRG